MERFLRQYNAEVINF